MPVTIRQKPRQATQMLNFMVINTTSAYNVILGQASLHSFKEVASTYHLKMKFPTSHEVGEQRDYQEMGRNFNVTVTLSKQTGGHALLIDDMDIREDSE